MIAELRLSTRSTLGKQVRQLESQRASPTATQVPVTDSQGGKQQPAGRFSLTETTRPSSLPARELGSLRVGSQLEHFRLEPFNPFRPVLNGRLTSRQKNVSTHGLRRMASSIKRVSKAGSFFAPWILPETQLRGGTSQIGKASSSAKSHKPDDDGILFDRKGVPINIGLRARVRTIVRCSIRTAQKLVKQRYSLPTLFGAEEDQVDHPCPCDSAEHSLTSPAWPSSTVPAIR